MGDSQQTLFQCWAGFPEQKIGAHDDEPVLAVDIGLCRPYRPIYRVNVSP